MAKYYREPNWLKRNLGRLVADLEDTAFGQWCLEKWQDNARIDVMLVGAVLLLLIGTMHWYLYELTWVYMTPDGTCIAIAQHNELRDCLGKLPSHYETDVVPAGTTLENIWNG